MATKVKPPNAGKGRVKGVPNKVTADVRAAVGMIAQGRAADVDRWLQQTAEGIREPSKKGKPGAWIVKPDPGKAAQIYFAAIEYHIPKLGRIEHTGFVQHTVAKELSDEELERIAGGSGDRADAETQLEENTSGVH
jgi:hypothetical protein